MMKWKAADHVKLLGARRLEYEIYVLIIGSKLTTLVNQDGNRARQRVAHVLAAFP
jgi:hypothetical protein